MNIAQERGRLVVPHCWKTGIGIAASERIPLPMRPGLGVDLNENAIRAYRVA